MVNFALADGAVRPIRKYVTANPAYSRFVYLCGFRDGQVVDPDGVLD